MNSDFSKNKHFKYIALSIPLLLVILAIWLPFGFNLTGLIEEWSLLGIFTQNKHLFAVGPTSPLAVHALRPLTVLPHAIAHFLDPDSFNYWHILLITALFVKGIASSTLVWQATGSLGFAMVAGVLVLIYPADTMQLSLRAIHINWSLALLLLSSTLFIAAYRTNKTTVSYTLGLISALLLWAAISMYEAGLTLVLLPFFITFVRDGLRNSLKIWSKKKILIALWFISIGLYLTYVVIVSAQIESYQQSILGHQSLFKVLQTNYSYLFSPGIVRSLLEGWYDALRILLKEIGYLGYLYVVIVSTLLFGFIHYLSIDKNESNSKALIGRLAIVGLLLTLLGFTPYLLHVGCLYISQRTYLFATFGAALVWTALFMTIAQWRKIPSLLLQILFISLGLAFQLFQFHHYVQISDTQRSLLKNIIANFDGESDKKNLIILDESQQIGQTWMFPTGALELALTYFYGHPIANIEVCYMPTKEWRRGDNLSNKGSCIETEKEWIFRAPPAVSGPDYTHPVLPPDLIIAKEMTTVLKIKPDGSVTPDPSLKTYRHNLLHNKDHLAKRYQNILFTPSWTNYFDKLWAFSSVKQYRWSFGDWWSMDLPIRGSGWREAGWTLSGFSHHASAWKNQENSNLIFNLSPDNKTYVLRGQFNFILNEPIRESIQIFLNQHKITYQWLADGNFEGEIPFSALLSGPNTITFHSNIDRTYFGLSAQLAWFEVFPAQGSGTT